MTGRRREGVLLKLQDLGNPKHLALETYRKDGRAVKSPV